MVYYDVRLTTNINDEFIFSKSDTEFRFAFEVFNYNYYIWGELVEYGINWGTDPLNLSNNSSTLQSLSKDRYSFLSREVNFANDIFDTVAPDTSIFIEPYFSYSDDETVGATGIVYEINSNSLLLNQKVTGGYRSDESWRNILSYEVEQSNVTNLQLEISSTPTFDTITNVLSVYSVEASSNLVHFSAEYLDAGVHYYRISADYTDTGIILTTPIEFATTFGYEAAYIYAVNRSTVDKNNIDFLTRIERSGYDQADIVLTIVVEVKEVSENVFTSVLEFPITFSKTLKNVSEYLSVPLVDLKGFSSNDLIYRMYYEHPFKVETIVTEEFSINVDFPELITPSRSQLLTGANSAERIHGSLIYNGFIYGSSRNYTGLVKIEQTDFSNVKNFVFYSTQLYETNSQYPLGGLEQVCRIDNYLYMKSDRYVIQFDTVTEEYKTFYGGTLRGEQPLVVDESFIYTPIEEDPINFAGMKWLKISHSKIVNASLPKFGANIGELEDIKPESFYDPESQGAHIDDATNYPESISSKGIVVHSAIVDNNFLYLAFTTITETTAGQENPLFELHKIDKSTMDSAGWCHIPKGTDDMCMSDTHLFVGIELSEPTDYGKDMGLAYIDKNTMTLKSLRYLSGRAFSANGYMALRFGNYLLVGYIDKSIFLLNLDNIDQWETEQYKGEFVDFHFSFDLASDAIYGIPNEALYNEVTQKFYFFIWPRAYEQESAIIETEFSQFDFSEPITVSAQYNREIASNTVSLLASITGTNEAFTLIDKGFEFDTSIGFETSQSFSIPVLDEFTIDVPDLAESTEYFYRAYLTYEGEAPILSDTLSFSYTHIYGLQGKVWETRDKLVFLEGANVGVIKMGESTIHSNLTTDANGEFRLELPDGLSDYMIFGNHIDSTRPIFPKRITPKIIG